MSIGRGIKLSTGFDLNAKAPLDNREWFETIEERNSLPDINLYEGLKCFVNSTKKNYQYVNGEWTDFGGGSGGGTDEELEERVESVENDVADLYDMLDELLYKPISITSFNASPSTAEIGSVVATLTLTWSYSKEIEWQKLDGVEIDKTIRKMTYNNVTSNKNYSIQANDGKTTASRSAGISFMNGKYTGVATEGIYDNSFILRLSKTLTTSKNGSFTVNCGEGQYIFFAIPTRFGVPKFSVGGFEGGFELVATIDFTNSSNYTEPYYVYKSENSNLGNTTVNVG